MTYINKHTKLSRNRASNKTKQINNKQKQMNKNKIKTKTHERNATAKTNKTHGCLI